MNISQKEVINMSHSINKKVGGKELLHKPTDNEPLYYHLIP